MENTKMEKEINVALMHECVRCFKIVDQVYMVEGVVPYCRACLPKLLWGKALDEALANMDQAKEFCGPCDMNQSGQDCTCLEREVQ